MDSSESASDGFRGMSHVNSAVLKVDYDASPMEGVHTLPELTLSAIRKFSDRPCISFRKAIRIHRETVHDPVTGGPKVWEVPEFSDPITLSYREWGIQLLSVARGLQRHLPGGPDLPPNEGLHRVAIYLSTRPEWLLTAHALWLNRRVVVTAYPTLGIDNLVKILNETEASCIVTEEKNLPLLESLVSDGRVPHLRTAIFCRDATNVDPELSPIRSSVLSAIRYEDVVAAGSVPDDDDDGEVLEFDGPMPQRDEVAIIMYTSGTTGDPKGVLMQHQNVVAGMCAGIYHFGIRPDDVVLAMLPLAHIMEQVVESMSICAGAQLAYGSPRTLSDTGAKPCGDFRCFRPTVFMGVPRLFETLKKKIEFKISQAGAVSRFLFGKAYAAKLAALQKGEGTPFWDWLVFSKFQAAFGGRVRWVCTGGAPLAQATHEFIQVLLGPAVVGQGYGATETAGCGTGRDFYDSFRPENVGFPLLVSECKLVSVPEMEYSVDDEPHERGEICIRGPHVCTSGYFKNPKATRKAFTEDGWYRTGDVGERLPDGSMRIIDRLHNFRKLANGEYLAVEPLHCLYVTSPFIAANGICCIIDSTKISLTAVVVPDYDYVSTWAARSGSTSGLSLREYCGEESLKRAILQDLKRLADSGKKNRYEYVKDVYLTSEEFTPENGLVNSAMKIRIQAVAARYSEEIVGMYSGLD